MCTAASFYRCSLLALLLTGQFAWAQHSTVVVYKHVDAQGRVTYANSPIKGGVVVDLQPLTIIPSTPGGSLGDAARAAAVSAATKPAVELPERSNVAQVTEVPSVRATSSTQQAAQVVLQRREDVRRRILEGEVETEQQLVDEVKTTLDVEQKRSNALRTMRASMGNAATGESKIAIERHFERLRDLQDQLAMHEANIADMKSQLLSIGSAKQARRTDTAVLIR